MGMNKKAIPIVLDAGHFGLDTAPTQIAALDRTSVGAPTAPPARRDVRLQQDEAFGFVDRQ
jgi:hypothetical protein